MEKYNIDLIAFISKRSGVNEDEINYNSLIEDDLGVSGDDAERLIVEFSKHFKVNINEFKFNKYFDSEPFAFDFLNHNNRKKELLTVEHLAKGILKGKLDDDTIES